MNEWGNYMLDNLPRRRKKARSQFDWFYFWMYLPTLAVGVAALVPILTLG